MMDERSTNAKTLITKTLVYYALLYSTLLYIIYYILCFHLLYCFDHGQPHVDTQHSMIGALNICSAKCATDAIVAVAQDFDPQLMVFLKWKNGKLEKRNPS